MIRPSKGIIVEVFHQVFHQWIHFRNKLWVPHRASLFILPAKFSSVWLFLYQIFGQWVRYIPHRASLLNFLSSRLLFMWYLKEKIVRHIGIYGPHTESLMTPSQSSFSWLRFINGSIIKHWPMIFSCQFFCYITYWYFLRLMIGQKIGSTYEVIIIPNYKNHEIIIE